MNRFKSKKASFLSAVAALIIAGLFVFFYGALKPEIPRGNAHADAIVVLAGSRQERIPAAAMLFRNGNSGLIILTNDGVRAGWSKKHQRNLYQVERAEEELVGYGVPRERIVKLPFYRSGTIYDALAVRSYLEGKALTSLIVVTSDYHERRALWTFRRVLGDRVKNMTIFGSASPGNTWVNRAVEKFKLIGYVIRYGLMG